MLQCASRGQLGFALVAVLLLFAAPKCGATLASGTPTQCYCSLGCVGNSTAFFTDCGSDTCSPGTVEDCVYDCNQFCKACYGVGADCTGDACYCVEVDTCAGLPATCPMSPQTTQCFCPGGCDGPGKGDFYVGCGPKALGCDPDSKDCPETCSQFCLNCYGVKAACGSDCQCQAVDVCSPQVVCPNS